MKVIRGHEDSSMFEHQLSVWRGKMFLRGSPTCLWTMVWTKRGTVLALQVLSAQIMLWTKTYLNLFSWLSHIIQYISQILHSVGSSLYLIQTLCSDVCMYISDKRSICAWQRAIVKTAPHLLLHVLTSLHRVRSNLGSNC